MSRTEPQTLTLTDMTVTEVKRLRNSTNGDPRFRFIVRAGDSLGLDREFVTRANSAVGYEVTSLLEGLTVDLDLRENTRTDRFEIVGLTRKP